MPQKRLSKPMLILLVALGLATGIAAWIMLPPLSALLIVTPLVIYWWFYVVKRD